MRYINKVLTLCLRIFANVYIPVLALLANIFITTQIFAQSDGYSTITGQVIDNETSAPIPHVNVIIEGTEIGASTNENGVFIIENVPPGNQTLQFSHINYIPLSYTHYFLPGLTETVTIEMVSRPIKMEEVEVVDTLPGRFTPGSPTGYHYTRKDIERTGANTFGQLIRTLVPRAQVREDGGDLYIQLQLRTTIAQRYERARDPHPLIILDGINLGTSPIGLAGVVIPSNIEHMEVIRPPDAQNIFGPDAAHGAIIIETIDRSDEEPVLTTTQRTVIAGGLAGLILSLILLN